MLETLVGRAFRRRERLSALDAPVSTAFPRPRSVETVADDAPGTDFSVQRTLGVETAELLTSRDLVDERTASSEIGLKLYHARGLGAGRQHLIAEAPKVLPPELVSDPDRKRRFVQEAQAAAALASQHRRRLRNRRGQRRGRAPRCPTWPRPPPSVRTCSQRTARCWPAIRP